MSQVLTPQIVDEIPKILISLLVHRTINFMKGGDSYHTSLLSIVQMPAGIPVGTLAIGEAGAKNAALLAVSILATTDSELLGRLKKFREDQTRSVTEQGLGE